MIFKEAMRSLKNSLSKAVFFALTFYITTTLLFVYFNMAYAATLGKPETFVNEQNLADLSQTLEKGNMANLMMVFIVVICAIDLIFCNDFFVKNKAKELAVRLICGATYIQMAMYLLIQTVVLMLVSIPLGIVSGYGLIHLLNSLLASYGEELLITVSSYAVIEFVTVEFVVIFWTTILNCSFAYKSGAVLLAGGNMGEMNDRNTYGLGARMGFRIAVTAAGIVLAVLPLYTFFKGSGSLAVSAVIGCAGLDRVITELFLPFLTRHNRKKGTSSTERITANGFLRRDIQFSRITVYLLICDLLVILTMLFSRENSRLEYLLVLVSFVSVSILQALTVMFRLETDLSSRQKQYSILSKIGTSAEGRKKIMHTEISKYYLFVILMLALYGGTALYSLYASKQADASQILFLSLAALAPLLVTDLLTRLFYSRIISEVN